jgi:hypothetical protein
MTYTIHKCLGALQHRHSIQAVQVRESEAEAAENAEDAEAGSAPASAGYAPGAGKECKLPEGGMCMRSASRQAKTLSMGIAKVRRAASRVTCQARLEKAKCGVENRALPLCTYRTGATSSLRL